MSKAATRIKVFSITALIVGIVNISGIPDNTNAAVGVMFLLAGVGGWVLAGRVSGPADDVTSLTVLDTHQGEDREKVELRFCDFVAVNAVREFAGQKDQGRDGVDFVTAANCWTLHLALGVRFARKYPEKAEAVLVRELGVQPPDGLDGFIWSSRIKTRKLTGDDNLVLQGIRAEFTTYFRKADEEGRGTHWIGAKTGWWLYTSDLEGCQTIDAASLHNGLFWTMKDAIAFGLFAPNTQTLEDFYNMSNETYHRDVLEVDDLLDILLEQYETHYGPILG